MKANQTRQNGRNYKKALCGYAAMGAVMILGASGGALLAVQAAETETETVLTGEVQMSAADLLLGVGGELIVGVGPESNIQIKEAETENPDTKSGAESQGSTESSGSQSGSEIQGSSSANTTGSPSTGQSGTDSNAGTGETQPSTDSNAGTAETQPGTDSNTGEPQGSTDASAGTPETQPSTDKIQPAVKVPGSTASTGSGSNSANRNTKSGSGSSSANSSTKTGSSVQSGTVQNSSKTDTAKRAAGTISTSPAVTSDETEVFPAAAGLFGSLLVMGAVVSADGYQRKKRQS